jgi:transposase InsO family protein
MWRNCPLDEMPRQELSSDDGATFAAILGLSCDCSCDSMLVYGPELGIRQSGGRTGICYDNALAESFNGTLKVERVHRTVYPTREHAREDIARASSFAIIASVFTRHSGTGPRKRSWTTTWEMKAVA